MYLPPNSIIVSGPVIIEEIDNKLQTLLNKHGKTEEKPNPLWQFCGGKVEDLSIPLEETAKREVEEEMGIKIEIEKPLETYLHKRDDNSVVILIHFLAKRIGEVTLGAEIEDWNWFPIDELPVDCAPNVKFIIEKFKADNK